MATETREVQVCDQCGTHNDVATWPQLGGLDLCEDCADEVRAAGSCVICGDSGSRVRLTTIGRNRYCDPCIEDAGPDDD